MKIEEKILKELKIQNALRGGGTPIFRGLLWLTVLSLFALYLYMIAGGKIQ